MSEFRPQSTFVPVVSAAPPPGYTLRQRLPLEPLRQACLDADETVRIERRLYRGGKELRRDTSELLLRGGAWIDGAGASYDLRESVDEGDWRSGTDVPFVETLIHAAQGRGFRSLFAPAFYTVFDSDRTKSFFNDNALKYANTIVIHQIQAFKAWVEGYPACAVDRNRDAGQSVLLINPHERPAVVNVELEGVKKQHRIRIGAASATRVDFTSLLPPDLVEWSGQAFVWGTNRVNMFFLSHKISEPHSITTMEHSEVYRGEHAYESWFGRLLRRRELKRRRGGAKVSEMMD